MISVRLLGHIRTSVGAESVDIPEDEIGAAALVDRVRSLSRDRNPGFNRFNTLAMVEDGEAFVPAAADRTFRSGERVVLLPFSHGG